ncbi:1-hydroxycarotenoid 3,4-desaturase CrtD [Qipengyuania sp. ASV99]|uniref:1-hydroxycarotenoid 3,4-desaturase CrtD n=1 Tax=Qipengyuania sp. ASV99 TaxID=3399681 RepID=UPI003A4C7434
MGGTVVVIGAGMGGLACAARLAARGYDVTVVEKEAEVGGKARRIMVDGQPIDAGPTVFTMRDVFDGIFAACGTRMEDHLRLRRAEVIARHAWDADQRLDLFADPLRSEEAIGDFAGSAAARGYREFRHETRRIHDILDQPMMRGDNVSTPLPLLWRIGLWRFDAFAAMRPHQNMWKALGKFFPDPRLQQLFGRYATYCGSSPFAAPATLMLIAHVEATGVWLIEGGIHALAQALRKVAEAKGARFLMGTAVTEIMTERGRGACGVRLANGEQIAADAVICNADPNAVAAGKFGQQSARAIPALAPAKRSLSAMVFYAHARTSGFELSHHNVFFSRDYAREFADIASGHPPCEPTVYLCAQDRGGRRSDAGPIISGQRERIQIIVNAPANGDTHNYPPQEIEQCTSQMRATLERCGLELEQGTPQEAASPAEWERLFPATGGALYGRASHGSAASFLRQGPRTRMPGLYCAGGATHPSAGVPMAALSGLLAAKKVHADLALTHRSSRVDTVGGISTRSARTGVTG